MSNLYRTVYEAMQAFQKVVPNGSDDVSERRKLEGMCVLTASFNAYTTTYPFFYGPVPPDAQIRTMRQTITHLTPFIHIYAASRRGKRKKRIQTEQRKTSQPFLDYVTECGGRQPQPSRPTLKHIRRKRDLYCLSLAIALQDPSALEEKNRKIGEIAERYLLDAYKPRGLVRDGQPDCSNLALRTEYLFFELLLTQIRDGVKMYDDR